MSITSVRDRLSHRRRLLSGLFALPLLAVSLFAVTSATAPASAVTRHCHAYASSLYKSDSTVIGKLTIDCNFTSSEIRILGFITKNGGTPPEKYRTCSNATTCTLILGRADSAGSQRYVVGFDPEDTQAYPAEFCPDMVCSQLAKNF